MNKLVESLLAKGFAVEERRKYAQTHLTRVSSFEVRHEVTIAPHTDGAACRIYCRYRSEVRDAWSEDAPFFMDIFGYELMSSGLAEVGTPGSAVWNDSKAQEFSSAFDHFAEPEFAKCSTLEGLRDLLADQLNERPKNRAARLTLAFVELQLGRAESAKALFEEYLNSAPPRIREELAPRIANALTSASGASFQG
jgi:hypothetical protein